ncbi:hypothetical protein BGW80DRAFT_423582 [Lactifluus volemus]|nr:hypothetical protein BGW80DRAFT_423582 [Lactifluus volemus]
MFLLQSTGRTGNAGHSRRVSYPMGSVHSQGADEVPTTTIVKYRSTGRGGAGNIVRDLSRKSEEPHKMPIDSGTGREVGSSYISGRSLSGRRRLQSTNQGDVDNAMGSTSRGRARRMRSDAFRPSNSNKSFPVEPDQRRHWYELDLIATLRSLQDTGVYSSGRGGAGNIVRSPPQPSGPKPTQSWRGTLGRIRPTEPTKKKDIRKHKHGTDQQPQGLGSNGRRGFVGPAPRELTGTEVTTLPHDDDHLQEGQTDKQHGGSHHLPHKPKKPPRSKAHGVMEILPRLVLRGAHKAHHDDGKEKAPMVPIPIDTPPQLNGASVT